MESAATEQMKLKLSQMYGMVEENTEKIFNRLDQDAMTKKFEEIAKEIRILVEKVTPIVNIRERIDETSNAVKAIKVNTTTLTQAISSSNSLAEAVRILVTKENPPH